MTDLVPIEAEVVAYSARPVMTPEVAAEQAAYKRDVLKAALAEGTDYDRIPGTPKPTLLKPGAEALLQFFGFGHHFEPGVIDYDKDGNKVGITYRCVVTKPYEGRDVVVSSCEGYASTEEKKWAKAPWNTIMKMAQKRALVGAALTATGTSGLLTQDMDDYAATTPTVAPDAIVDEIKRLCRALPERGQEWMRMMLKGATPLAEMTAAELAGVLVEIGKTSAEVRRDDFLADTPAPAPAPDTSSPPLTPAARKKLFAVSNEAGLDDDRRHALAARLTDGRTSSFAGLYQSEVTGMIDLIDEVKAGRIAFQTLEGEDGNILLAVEVTDV